MSVASPFLERYLAGEHRPVWAELTAMGNAVRDDPIVLAAAQAVAIEAMTRLARNIDRLLDRLSNQGYRFEVLTIPAGVQLNAASRALCTARALAWHGRELPMSAFRACEAVEAILGGPLPIALRKAFELVGEVSFIGTSPDWPRSGHVFFGPIKEGVMPTDPFMLRGVHDLLIEAVERQVDDNFSIPFTWDIWLDIAAKAGYSGAGYSISLPDAGFDLMIESKAMIDHVRDSLLVWGGFPGAADINDFPRSRVAELTEGLEPF